MGDVKRVTPYSGSDVSATDVQQALTALADIPGAFAVVECVTAVSVIASAELSTVDIEELEALRVFWAEGEIRLRRTGAAMFAVTALCESSEMPSGVGAVPGNPIQYGFLDEYVLPAIGTRRVVLDDGSVALSEARLGKPYRVPGEVVGDGGMEFVVYVYRDEHGCRAASRYAGLVPVEDRGHHEG